MRHKMLESYEGFSSQPTQKTEESNEYMYQYQRLINES